MTPYVLQSLVAAQDNGIQVIRGSNGSPLSVVESDGGHVGSGGLKMGSAAC